MRSLVFALGFLLAVASFVREGADPPSVRAAGSAAVAAPQAAIAAARRLLAEAKDAWQAGDLATAREHVARGVELLLAAATSAEDERVTALLADLGRTAYAAQDLKATRDAWSRVLRDLEGRLPEEHAELQEARGYLAIATARLGDLPAARALQERALAIAERTLREDDPELQKARMNLSATLNRMGELARARDLIAAVVAVRERTLPPEHPHLQLARLSLASTLTDLGDLEGALSLEEQVLRVYGATLPEDDLDLQEARMNLVATLYQLGDLARCRALIEKALPVLEEQLPMEHPDLRQARLSHAILMVEMGDLVGARAVLEEDLERLERSLPAGHPHLLRTQLNLAETLWRMGDLAGSAELEEGLLATLTATLPETHRDVLLAMGNLAVTRKQSGDLEGARELEEKVLEICEQTRPEDHPDSLRGKFALARTMQMAGGEAGARELQEKVLAARERTLPPGHPDLRMSRLALCEILVALDEPEAAGLLLERLVEDMRTWARSAVGLSPRQSMEKVGSLADELDFAIEFSRFAERDDELGRAIFELSETIRSLATSRLSGATEDLHDAEVNGLRERALALRERVNELVAALVAGREAEGEGAGDLARVVLERDRVEAAWRRKLLEAGQLPREVDAGTLSAALQPDAVAVGYKIWRRRGHEAGRGRAGPSELQLLAHVMRGDGSLARVELGPLAAIEKAVFRWRATVGEPIGRGVGVFHAAESEDAEHRASEELRALVLDPVLKAVGPASAMHVCPDGPLHLVPLDALVLEDELVGDRYAVRREVSFSRLLASEVDPGKSSSLVALGGVDFGAAPRAGDPVATVSTPPVGGARAGDAVRFTPLPATNDEIVAIAELFVSAFEHEAEQVTGGAATKAALFALAPQARWLHMATHGWFADESVRSWSDSPLPSAGRRSLEAGEAVVGMAPMTLCGLALTGANTGTDALGRVPGIVTAEEICGMSLGGCELAVLSACETNVGIRRAGLGMQSLQAALHAAGARSVITSLWKVPDKTTKDLMVDFYRRLWVEKKPKWQALWEAKMALRDEGHPTRDWAAWVLTGDPD